MMIPARVAIALQADGWYLRSDIIWHKPNPMPESVTDRPTKAHEYIFLLAKQERYFYDAAAIEEKSKSGWNNRGFRNGGEGKYIHDSSFHNSGGNFSKRYSSAQPAHGGDSQREDSGFRNRRSVWTVPTHSYSGAHFATFPPKLIEPCILAGSREGDTVLDPFAGTATVGVVCAKYRRNFVGLDLNRDYIALAQQRTASVQLALPQ